jgi:hypothetical protein
MTDNELANTKQNDDDSSDNSISDEESERVIRQIRKLRPTRSATPTPRRPNFHTKVPKSALFARIESNDSPEQEFNGYPSFWEQRLKSGRKSIAEKTMAPHSVPRSLAHELFDDEDGFPTRRII